MTTSPARIAIIGTGWWATEDHVPAILEHPDATLVALCDANLEKARMTADAYKLPERLRQCGDLLANEQLDGAIVVTNHATHYQVAKACLQAGVNLLIEKPMTLFAREAERTGGDGRGPGRADRHGLQPHYSPYAIRAQEIVASGAWGIAVRPRHLQPACDAPAGGPVCRDREGRIRVVHSPADVYSDPRRSGGRSRTFADYHPLFPALFSSAGGGQSGCRRG